VHVIIVKWKIKPEHIAEFEATMKAHIQATRRTEPGCVRFDVAVDKQDPRTYHLFEIYADDQAILDHAKSPTLAALREKGKDWVEERGYATATLWPPIPA
jgi:(4S)-4-hydroxy-5-phosphonooxypentane-2,3-dione isomerase